MQAGKLRYHASFTEKHGYGYTHEIDPHAPTMTGPTTTSPPESGLSLLLGLPRRRIRGSPTRKNGVWVGVKSSLTRGKHATLLHCKWHSTCLQAMKRYGIHTRALLKAALVMMTQASLSGKFS